MKLLPKSSMTFTHTSLSKTRHVARPHFKWEGKADLSGSQRREPGRSFIFPGRKIKGEERTEVGEGGEERGRKEGKCRQKERVGNQRGEGRNGQLLEAGMSSEENSWIIDNRLGYLDLGEIRAFLALFWLCSKVLKLRDPRRLSACPPSEKGGSATDPTAA